MNKSIIFLGCLSMAFGASTLSLYVENNSLKAVLASKPTPMAVSASAHTTNIDPAAANHLTAKYDLTSMPPCNAQAAFSADRTDDMPEMTWARLFQSESLQARISHHYAPLLSELALSTHDEKNLHQYLIEREQILDTPVANSYTDQTTIERNMETQRQALTSIDERINALLGTDAARTFELIKDSGFEQQQMQEFARHLGDETYLSQAQHHNLLLAKLEHKQTYENTLQAYQHLAHSSKQTDRAMLFDMASESLQRYRDEYLQDAAKYLDEKQFAELSGFEAIQFEDMETSLRLGLHLN